MNLGGSEVALARVGLGGNTFGWTSTEPEAFAVLDQYVAAGGNLIDTADAYSQWADGNAGGESETIIGSWLRRRGKRDDVVIATKVGAWRELKGLAPSTIRKAVEASLSRLQTDHIDLYYAHVDDETVPQEETLGAFAELVDAGKVRAIGASNFSAARLASALAISDANGWPRYVALQNKYNLLVRDFEGELSDLCAHEAVACIPYQGLAGGVLTGKYRTGKVEGDASPRATHALAAMGEPRTVAVVEALTMTAERLGVTPAAVALAWLAGKSTVQAPLASARTVEQLVAIVQAQELTLSDEDMTRLDQASAS